ncbi:MAG: hypothetical protein GX442_12980 [Candidatus Riflebacteria bacterium]|nr:hypothetical protein [Candidatus Riflebacteria bacterium]
MKLFDFNPATATISIDLGDFCEALRTGDTHALLDWLWKPGTPALPEGALPVMDIRHVILLLRVSRQASFRDFQDFSTGLGLPDTTDIRLGVWVDPGISDDTIKVRALFVGHRAAKDGTT